MSKPKQVHDALWTAFNTPEEDTLTCGECEEQLPDYIAYLDGRQSTTAQQENRYKTQWQPIERHLRGCPYCLEVFAELRHLQQQALRIEDFADLPEVPMPNLAFLQPSMDAPTADEDAHQVEMSASASYPQKQNRWYWLDEAGRLVIEFSAQVLASFTLSPQLSVKGDSEQRLLYSHTLDQALSELGIDDLQLSLQIQASSNHSDQCELFIDVNIPSLQGWPNLADSQVVLWHNQEKLAEAWTDAYGKVVFGGIERTNLDGLRLTVRRKNVEGV